MTPPDTTPAPTTAQLVESIPGYTDPATLLAVCEGPLGWYAALAAYRGATIPLPPPTPTGGTVRMWQDSAFASERIAQEQRARAERCAVRSTRQAAVIAGRRKQAHEAPPADKPFVPETIIKASQYMTKAAHALGLPDVTSATDIDEKARLICDYLVERSQTLRVVIAERDEYKQREEVKCREISRLEARVIELKRGFDARAAKAQSASEPGGRDSAQTAPAQGARST